MEKELSIIIVNYKSQEYLKGCLDSIRNKIQDVDYEIIVVNNDSSGLNLEGVKLIDAGSNLGFGKANNLGAKESQGKYILFLNPDTQLLSGSVKKILDDFEVNNQIEIIGPKLLDECGKIEEWSAGYEVNLTNLIRNNIGLTKNRKIWESKTKKEADCVSGAALFVRRKLFDQLGGFDENFFMYFEDEDLCKRARDKGYKVMYFPEVEIKHLCGKSFENENKKTQKKYYYASQDYYFQKHFGKTMSWVVKILRRLVTIN